MVVLRNCTRGGCYLGLSVCAIVIRLIGKNLYDGSALYNSAIVPLTHIVLSIGILLTIDWFLKNVRNVSGKTALRILSYFDKLSIYVYISHSWLYNGTLLSVFQYSYPIALGFLVFIVSLLAISTILMYIGSIITKQIGKVVNQTPQQTEYRRN